MLPCTVALFALLCPACAPSVGSADEVPLGRVAQSLETVVEIETPESAPGTEQADVLAARWGVEVIGVRRTAAGAFLDFRYRVLDADKAKPLMDHTTDAQLIPHSVDTRLVVPTSRLGSMRQTNRSAQPAVGRTYFALFGNPGAVVGAGDRVDVVIGDFKATGLVVQ